jgi:hypothetical protein
VAGTTHHGGLRVAPDDFIMPDFSAGGFAASIFTGLFGKPTPDDWGTSGFFVCTTGVSPRVSKWKEGGVK